MHMYTGLSKEAAVQRYIEKVCELEMSGATIYHGYYEDKPVCVEVGSRHVHIIDTHHKTLNRCVHTCTLGLFFQLLNSLWPCLVLPSFF